jgi:hypothetical protein
MGTHVGWCIRFVLTFMISKKTGESKSATAQAEHPQWCLPKWSRHSGYVGKRGGEQTGRCFPPGPVSSSSSSLGVLSLLWAWTDRLTSPPMIRKSDSIGVKCTHRVVAGAPVAVSSPSGRGPTNLRARHHLDDDDRHLPISRLRDSAEASLVQLVCRCLPYTRRSPDFDTINSEHHGTPKVGCHC